MGWLEIMHNAVDIRGKNFYFRFSPSLLKKSRKISNNVFVLLLVQIYFEKGERFNSAMTR